MDLIPKALALAALVLLLSTGLSGCIAPVQPAGQDEGAQGKPTGDDAPEGPKDNGSASGNGDAGSNDDGSNDTGAGAAGDTTDEESVYRLPLSPMRWDHTDIVVLVVPPSYGRAFDLETDPWEGQFLRAVEDSITHWQEAIDTDGSDELSGNVTFAVHVLGRDIVDPMDIPGVDIYITNPPGGVYLAGLAAYPLSPRCVIANFVNPLQDYRYMFNVAAHEFGHCLGLSHPDDHKPWFDVMSYSHIHQGDAEDLRLDCVSNLNLMGVHEAFAPAFDRESADAVEIHATGYDLIDCADRFLE